MASKSLGTLTLDLVARVGGFVAGMDQAEKSMQKLQRSFQKNAGQGFKNLAVAGAAVAAATAAATAAIIKSTSESEQAVKQLEARLKSTGGVSGKTAEELKTLAGALQNTTTYGDEAILGMETLLLKFTNLRGEIYDETVPAVLDVSAALGIDLTAAAILVGRALNDPIKGMAALAKSGVTFSDRQKDVIKQLVETGRTIEAQKIILAGFNQQFGGAAVAAADTFSGALTQIQNAFGELLESPSGLKESKKSLQEFRDILRDPETVRAAGQLTSALVDGFVKAGEALGPINFLLQEIKATLVGPSDSDIPRLLDEIADYEKRLKYPVLSYRATLKFDTEGNQGIFDAAFLSDEELKAGIAKNQALIDAAYKRINDAQAAAQLEPITVTAQRRLPQGRTKDEIKEQTEAQKEAERAAKAAAQAAEQHAQAIRDSVGALQFQSDTVGKSADEIKLLELALDGATDAQLEQADAALKTVAAFEANKKAQEDYQALLKDLRTDEEVLTDQLSERLAVLNAIANVPESEREKVKSRIAAEAVGIKDGETDAPKYAGLDAVVGGAFGEIDKINDAQAELEKWYAKKLELLAENRAAQSELNAQWDEQEKALAAAHADELLKIEKARQLASYTAMEDLFGSLAGLTKQFAGENSEAYRIAFAAEKAAAIARSVIAIQTALAQASASAPFPANIAAMASVAAQTASIISTIASTTVGSAHDGMMSVPKTGSYILEKGERVTTEKTSAKLDKTLAEAANNKQYAQAPVTNLRVVNSFDSHEVVGGYLGSADGEKAIMNVVRRNRRTIQSLTT